MQLMPIAWSNAKRRGLCEARKIVNFMLKILTVNGVGGVKMHIMQWTPHVTVAAIVEQQGKFLLVEEETPFGRRFNQPAGHLENHESLLQAVVRETLEETAHTFQAQAILGVYQWQSEAQNISYIRFAFIGTLTQHHPHRHLDTGILRVVWMSIDEMRAQASFMRSPQVVRCAEDYWLGQRFPLQLLNQL